MPHASSLCYSADEITAAMTATSGNVSHAARRLGIDQTNLRGHAKRRGIDLRALRAQIRSRALMVALPPYDPPVSGDHFPLAQPILAVTVVDLAAMSLALINTQAELEREQHINAALVASLEALGAQIEGTPSHG